MTHLAKLTFKTVDRSTKRDPIIARRDKLVAGLKEQKLVHTAALNKQDHRVERHKWMTNDMGERVAVKAMRTVRPWFFAQDGGWVCAVPLWGSCDRGRWHQQRGVCEVIG